MNKFLLFLTTFFIILACTKNSDSLSQSIESKSVLPTLATVEVSCSSCAITDSITIYGSGYTAGKDIAALAQRAEDGWQLWYHATVVDEGGNISFEYLYKRPAGHYTVIIYQLQNSKKYVVIGSVQFVTY